MNITTVEKITELADGDTVLVISNQDIKQVPKEQVSDVKKIAGLEAEITELKKSGRDGREDLASAITEKGVITEAGEDMHEMAAKVRKIPKGQSYWLGICAEGISGESITRYSGIVAQSICGKMITYEEETTDV